MSSALVLNFDDLADLLLRTSDYFDIDSQEAAMGALAKLIEQTPRTLVAEYGRLLGKLVNRLEPLLQPDAPILSTQLIVDLLSLIQAIVMNLGAGIGPEAGKLAKMLVSAIGVHKSLASEMLPTLGALARAMNEEFAASLETLLELVFAFLKSSEHVRPAAVFVSDILCSGIKLEWGLVSRIVTVLTSEFERFDTLTYETRLALLTALCDLAKYVGKESVPWLDRYLDLLEQEAKAALTLENDETVEPDRPKSFATVCLQLYQSLVSVLAEMKNGDRKVRSFFHIFEQLLRLDCVDDALLPDCVVLIMSIAETFKRKMNVFLNKPAVIELLRRAEESENPRLAALGQSTWQIVKSF